MRYLIAFLLLNQVNAGQSFNDIFNNQTTKANSSVIKKGIEKIDNSKKDATILIGLNAGTLGGGFDLSLKLSKYLQMRYNFNSFEFNKDGLYSIDKVPYFAKMNLSTQGVIVDYFPFESLSLHLSAGIYKNKNRVDSKIITKNEPVKFGDSEYTFDLLQRVDTEVNFKKEVPYIGFGLGGKITEKGLGWSFDAGVLYHGDPKVKMTPVYGVDSINTVNIKKAIDNEVKKEEDKFYKKIKKYNYYPVVKFGLNYSF